MTGPFSLLAHAPRVITEGSLVERLHRRADLPLDPHIAHAAFIYAAAGRAALEEIYRRYLDVGRDHRLPIVVFAPTWRASADRLRRAGWGADKDVNGDGVRFVQAIRETYGDCASRIIVGALLACAGNAYDPSEALGDAEASRVHRPQADRLAAAGPDFLMAATLPAASEALGLARAMAATRTPYLLSFVLRGDGTLLDGTPLSAAIGRVDGEVDPAPAGYMINCVHPDVCAAALDREPAGRRRVWGLQANTSPRSPEELDRSAATETEDPERFADGMVRLHERFGLRILGGCCGTDERHIGRLAERLTALGGGT